MNTLPKPKVDANAFTTGSVTSKDGTDIGYRQIGSGPGVIIVSGAMVHSGSFTGLATALAPYFTVYIPDRRGRGLSGETGANYGMQKEVEDIAALVNKTKATNIFGLSAGGLIALESARRMPAIKKVAAYEPAFLTDTVHTDWLEQYDQEMAEGKVSAALVTSMIGLELGPPIFAKIPRGFLAWVTDKSMASEDKKAKPEDMTMRKLAPSIHNEGVILREMLGRMGEFNQVNADVLLLEGSKGLPYLKATLKDLEKTLPHVTGHIEFPGLDHGSPGNMSPSNRNGKPEVVAQALVDFFNK